MTTMREDAVIKASQGLTTLEEVVRLTAPDSQ
jgi:type II secretory ATPase GspE/PulE/Tfp pilus assembly ATPase PilB-like protein